MWIFSLDVYHLTPEPLELVGGVLRASWKYRSVTIPPAAPGLQPACSVSSVLDASGSDLLCLVATGPHGQ